MDKEVNNYNKYGVEVDFNTELDSSEKENIIEEIKEVIIKNSRNYPTEILMFEKETRFLFIVIVETNSLSYRKKAFNSFFEKTLKKIKHGIIPLNNQKVKYKLIEMLKDEWKYICPKEFDLDSAITYYLNENNNQLFMLINSMYNEIKQDQKNEPLETSVKEVTNIVNTIEIDGKLYTVSEAAEWLKIINTIKENNKQIKAEEAEFFNYKGKSYSIDETLELAKKSIDEKYRINEASKKSKF